jgi:hypothetical protein
MTIRELDGTLAEKIVVGREYEVEDRGVRMRVSFQAPANRSPRESVEDSACVA